MITDRTSLSDIVSETRGRQVDDLPPVFCHLTGNRCLSGVSNPCCVYAALSLECDLRHLLISEDFDTDGACSLLPFQSGFRYITILRTFRQLIDDEEAIALFAIKRLLIWLPLSSNRSFAVDAVAVILANNGYRLPQEVSMRF